MSYDPSSTPSPGEKPGIVESLFIHLAGADPGTFTKLPRSETSEFVKLGMTVLVPFGLALIAGTFTLYTLQDPDGKSVAKAAIFGVFWALGILIIDVAVMSQLVKGVPIELGNGRQSLVARETPTKKGGKRTRFVAIIRILIATTLGLFMSHCLVLYIFKSRIEQQVNVNRIPQIEKINGQYASIDEKSANLDRAIKVKNEVNPEKFLAEYRKLAGYLTTADASVLNSDAGLANNVSRLNAEIAELQNAYDLKWGGFDRMKQEILEGLDNLERDVKQADLMLRYEKGGNRAETFQFLTSEFKALGVATSGIQGDGTRSTRIGALIDVSRNKISRGRQEVAAKATQRDSEKTTLDAQLTAKLADRAQYESKMKDVALLGAGTAHDLAAKSRILLDEQITKARNEIDNLVVERDRKLEPLRSGRSDIWEQSVALHDLMLGKGDESQAPTRQGMMIGIVLLVMACFMFIDLTPLLMKMTKEPGLYERLRQQEKAQSLARFMSDSSQSNSYMEQSPQRQQNRSDHVPPHRRR